MYAFGIFPFPEWGIFSRKEKKRGTGPVWKIDRNKKSRLLQAAF